MTGNVCVGVPVINQITVSLKHNTLSGCNYAGKTQTEIECIFVFPSFLHLFSNETLNWAALSY